MDTTQKLTPKQLYYQKNKEIVKERVKVARLLKKPDKNPAPTPVLTTEYTDDTQKRIHFARFRRALKAIKRGDAHHGFYEDIWLQKFKDVVLEYAENAEAYYDFKVAKNNGTKDRCDRCGEVFKKRPETNQYTCWACMNTSRTRAVCHITPF